MTYILQDIILFSPTKLLDITAINLQGFKPAITDDCLVPPGCRVYIHLTSRLRESCCKKIQISSHNDSA